MISRDRCPACVISLARCCLCGRDILYSCRRTLALMVSICTCVVAPLLLMPSQGPTQKSCLLPPLPPPKQKILQQLLIFHSLSFNHYSQGLAFLPCRISALPYSPVPLPSIASSLRGQKRKSQQDGKPHCISSPRIVFIILHFICMFLFVTD